MDDEYEVPSPHEHAIDEEAERQDGGLAQKIALMTAVLATLGALISYKSGSAQTQAMFLKNESILKQSQASDQWAYYQSKSMKEHIAEATADTALTAAIKDKYQKQKAGLDKEKLEIQTRAQKLEEQSRELSEKSEATLRPHERLALAMTFIQISVALAAITVLTKRTWLLWASVGAAAVGIAATVSALLMG